MTSPLEMGLSEGGWSYLFIFGCQAVENVYYLEKKQRAESFVEIEHQAYKPLNIEL